MKVTPPSLESQLREQLHSERGPRTVAVDKLLEEARNLDAWSHLSLPGGVAQVLSERARAVADELAAVLVSWTRRGGTVSLATGGVTEEELRTDIGGSAPFAAAVPAAPAPARTIRRPEPVSPPAPAHRPATAGGAATPPTVAAPPAAVAAAPPAVAAPPPLAIPPAVAVAEPFPARVGGAESPARPAADASALKELKARFSPVAVTRAKDWREQLEASVKQLGRPALDDDTEVEAVRKFVLGCADWVALPKDMQRALVGMAVTRLRRLQDDRQRADLDDCFSQLTAFSRREQPGYVNGLSRTHRPEGESWGKDFEQYLEIAREPWAEAPKPNQEKLLLDIERVAGELGGGLESEVLEAVRAQFVREVRDALEGGVSAKHPRLARIAAPFAELLDGNEFRNLRRSIRELQADDEDPEDDRPAVLPPDWGWWGRTRGRRGLMIGGDPREPNRKRLEETFAFESLAWLPTEFRRNSLQAARDRLRAGKVDILIILGRFVGHDCDEVLLPPAREHGVDWVHLDKGYGAVRLKTAIERFLEPKP